MGIERRILESHKEDAISFFGTPLTCLITVLHLYVFIRLAFLPLCSSKRSRKAVRVSGVILWLVFFLGRLFRSQEGDSLVELFEVLAMQWIGIVFLLAVALLVADVLTVFGLVFPKQTVLRIRTAALVGGIFLVLIAHVQGLRPPVPEEYEITVNDLPADLDGLQVAVLSDLHLGEMFLGPNWLNARAQQIQELKPDAIFLVGDLFEREHYPVMLSQALHHFSAPLGVFAVLGNNDALRHGGSDFARKILEDSGIQLLSNERTELAAGLVLAGLDDIATSDNQEGAERAHLPDLIRTLDNRPAGATILLSHTPWLVEQAASNGVGLMLSGHTHNGQIWPFNYLVRRQYPFLAGHYALDDMDLIVCRGTGTWGPRMRLWQRGEIALITLRSPIKLRR